jgi:hypothetical protein
MIPRAGIFLLVGLFVGSCRHVAPEQPKNLIAQPEAPVRPSAVAARVQFFVEALEGGSLELALPQSGVRIAVRGEPILTEADLVAVELGQVELGRCLLFHLTPAAARRIDALFASDRGRRLVLSVNDVALGARRLDQPIGNGPLTMFVEVPDVYLPRLLATLKPNDRRVGRSPALVEKP